MNSGRKALFGLLLRSERWGLSLRGWVLVFLITLGMVLELARNLYPFLAITQLTSGEILVVEGWIHSDSVEQAVREYKAANYQCVLVVSAVYDVGNKWDSRRYKSEYIADDLIGQGVPKDRVHVIFCAVAQKDRTYQSALAVREWLHEQGRPVKFLDVVTIGPHARRSKLLFHRVFRQDEVKIGVLAMSEREYDPEHWWRSSEGIREVLFEAVAYLYVKWFFVP